MPKTIDFIKRQVSIARASQRSGDFLNRNKNSLSLSGKSIEILAGCTDQNKLHEIILPGEEDVERFEGDAVTSHDVYKTSDNVVWNGNGEVKFMGPDNILLSAIQYDYISKNGPLSKYSYFGKSNNKDYSVAKVWRELHRKSTEALKDKGKSILYLTIGSMEWTRDPATATKPADRVTSPLLLCPIESNANAKDMHRFLIKSNEVKINTMLKRELTLRNMDVFYGINDTIPFTNMVSALEKIAENAVYTPNVEVNVNDLNICILDSTNESICQLIENNIDKLAESPLLQVFAGDLKYSQIPIEEAAPYAIYPLLADITQRDVIECVRRGESINISAAAGTGKSQTIANIAAMFASNNAKVLLLSEKPAALEVVLKYLGDTGLDKFTLFIKNNITVPELIEQFDRIRNNERVYLDPIASRDLLEEIAEIEKTFADYNTFFHRVIPKVDMSLYELIGDATLESPVDNLTSLNVSADNYRYAARKLDELQSDINGTIDESDFIELMNTGTTGDDEIDILLNSVIDDLKKNGVDVVRFVSDNNIPVSKIASTVKANMANIIANSMISDNEIGQFGNMTLRTKYAKLCECYTKLTSLSAGYVQQKLGEIIAKAIDENYDFINMLERFKNARMSTVDFFKRYGATVMKFCPIVLTTPAAAVNYITDEMNDFDAVLIDEASQVPIINVLPFLVSKRPRLVAFGDNNQLDITSFFHSNDDDSYDENGEFDISRTDRSILHLVQGKGIPAKRLSYHYRSKTEHLFNASNKLCYNGNINVVPDVYTGWEMLPEELGFELNKIDIPFDPALAAASAVTKKRKTKTVIEYPYLEDYEKRVADKMAQDIAAKVASIREEYPDKSIGIVTLNDHFQDRIMDELESIDLMDYEGDEEALFVRSLENAQGREADIIIIAIEHAKRNIKGNLTKNISGFFNSGELTEQSGNNRLNVLFTRAREKNIIYVAFDYKEIKDTERSLKRLFTYLEYAATGNMSCISEPRRTVDKTNEHAKRVIEKALEGKTVRSKVGNGTLMVDLAVMDKPDSEKYSMAYILPDRALDPVELWTKINRLERTGWHVLPLSHSYFLNKQEAFAKQLPRMMKVSETTNLGYNESCNFLIDTAPEYPITLEEIATRGSFEKVIDKEENERETRSRLIRSITTEELAAIDLEAKCRNACADDIKNANQAYIEAHFKSNYQAFLVKLAQSVQKYAALNDGSKLEFLASKVSYLYKNLREKRACFLLASLMRLDKRCEEPEKQETIRNLLEEAISLNIIKEVI